MRKIASLKRRILIAFIFVFVLGFVAPTVVFYSLGYRFDWSKKIFVHSGSIVFKSTPEEVSVKLDGKIVSDKSLDLINRSININGLTPRKYVFEVNAEGYKPWKKEVEVHSGIATEFWNIVLIPNSPIKKNILQNSFLSYAFSPNKKKLAFFEKKDEWVSLLIREGEIDTVVYKESVNQRIVPEDGELKWSKDNKWLIFSLKQDKKEKIFLVGEDDKYSNVVPLGEIWKETLMEKALSEISEKVNANQNKTSKNNKNLAKNKTEKPLPEEIKEEGIKTFYSWDDRGNIYFLLEGKIYMETAANIHDWWAKQKSQLKNEEEIGVNNNINAPGKTNSNSNSSDTPPQQILLNENAHPRKIQENMSGFTFCDNYICGVNTKNLTLDFVGENGEVLESVPFPEGAEKREDYKLFAYGNEEVAILDGDKNLLLWDEKESKETGVRKLKFISSSVEEVYFSNDGKKLLFGTEKEVYVYFLRDWDVQPKHLAGSKELLWKGQEKIKLINWYLDYQNFFVVFENKVYFVELDSRGGRNVNTFFEGPKIYNFSYDTGERKIWFLEGEKGIFSDLKEIPFPPLSSFFQSIIRGQENNQ